MTIVAINIRALHKYLVRPVERERKNRIRNGLQDAGPLADGWEEEEDREEIAMTEIGTKGERERERTKNVCENSSTSSPP